MIPGPRPTTIPSCISGSLNTRARIDARREVAGASFFRQPHWQVVRHRFSDLVLLDDMCDTGRERFPVINGWITDDHERDVSFFQAQRAHQFRADRPRQVLRDDHQVRAGHLENAHRRDMVGDLGSPRLRSMFDQRIPDKTPHIRTITDNNAMDDPRIHRGYLSRTLDARIKGLFPKKSEPKNGQASNALTAFVNWAAWYGLARNLSGLAGAVLKMSSPTVPLTSRIFWRGSSLRNASINCIPFIECIA